MCSPKVLAFLIGSIYALFVYFLFSNNLFFADSTSALLLPIITLAYFCTVKHRSIFFVLFLVFYSISDLMIIISDNLTYHEDYFIGNTLYILAYISLTIEIGRNLSLKYTFKNNLFSIIVLFILNTYIAYVLSQIVNPYLELGAEYVLEIVYNISMLMILSLGLLNYFYKNNRKAFYILIGALCIVFAEVINIAYMYVSHQNLLNFLTISLGLVGFYFLYAQAKLKYEKQDEISF
ncbi:hypothetical protein [Jejuia pallidilutea]|jgi:hemolysin-activating ACP:hemolysin acyltransferase|uniref:YhhN-like protein n=1 Tax=Jejuia pallidilutea TaxID=504487 RepID=A0A090VNX5_9FLAO|nr:hypothetical protein [Jejuia pallidilutea]GAL65733.1 hypothetical protein JCM19301_3418 [Jejuia pallidilutea]GAL72828.1 hypothetical protein JCM19302_188 [Jejuia pallidilutea]GAL88605.1 hypothetical protein JCM19538_3118 [Jejuia pallidilutea]